MLESYSKWDASEPEWKFPRIVRGAIKKFRDSSHKKAISILYLDVAAIPFEVFTLCNDKPFPAFLPCLECFLIVLFFKRVKYHLRFALDLLHGVKTPALQLKLYLWEEEEAAGSQIRRVGRVWSDDRAGAAQMFAFFLTHCERVRCHVGAPNSHPATVQDVCAVCALSHASERCC